jgi:hypothetical protein
MSGKTTYEVGVDAIISRVLENKKEGPHPDSLLAWNGQGNVENYFIYDWKFLRLN